MSETLPADIAAAITFLAEKALFAGRFADADLIDRSLSEGRAHLTATILRHLRGETGVRDALVTEYWECHIIPWWREKEYSRKGYTINIDPPKSLEDWIERLLGIAESRAVKLHRSAA